MRGFYNFENFPSDLMIFMIKLCVFVHMLLMSTCNLSLAVSQSVLDLIPDEYYTVV